MWTKVKKCAGSPAGRPARTRPAVRRLKSDPRGVALIFPAEFMPEPTCNVYSDGNGKLAFEPALGGTYKVSKDFGALSRCRRVAIPSIFADRIPFGTTEVTLARDGHLHVLDLNAL